MMHSEMFQMLSNVQKPMLF